MKSTKVQTLGAVACYNSLHRWCKHCWLNVHPLGCTCYSFVHACAYAWPLSH